MKKLSHVTLLLMALLTAHVAHSANDAAGDLLKRMHLAANTLNYEGYALFGKGKQWQSMHILHGIADGVAIENVRYLDGPERSFTRRGNDVVCLEKGLPSRHLAHNGAWSNASFLPAQYDWDGAQGYDVRLGDIVRVADRDARAVVLKAKDKYRYHRRLWLDQETGLLLKSELANSSAILERFQWVHLQFGIVPRSESFAQPTDEQNSSNEKSERAEAYAVVSPSLQVSWVPEAFEPIISYDLKQGVKTLYSDGFGSITVFLEQTDQVLPPMDNRMGATSVSVRYTDHNQKRYRVTVVGEVPLIATKQIATSSLKDIPH